VPEVPAPLALQPLPVVAAGQAVALSIVTQVTIPPAEVQVTAEQVAQEILHQERACSLQTEVNKTVAHLLPCLLNKTLPPV
jgi:hypothetical protein